MEYDISRLNGIFIPEKVDAPIHIIGSGATGSFVAMELARIGCKVINIYDKDDVGVHNISNQYFTQTDVGKQKVNALKEKLLSINPNIIVNAFDQWVTIEDMANMEGYIFLLVDSMKVREELWNAAKLNSKIKYVWESRLGSDQARVYCLPIIQDFDYKRYEQDFYKDDVAEVSACGTSITVLPIVLQTASLLVIQFMDIVMERKDDIPFKTIFDNYYNKYEESFKPKEVIENDPTLVIPQEEIF